MELFYNPDVMPPSEVKQTFVARAWLVDEILALADAQPEGAGVQHVLLVGPRGMGKTTLLIMLEFAVQEGRLRTAWQAVRFNEESYAITDLADFWLTVINHLGCEALGTRARSLENDYRTSDDLAEAALALLRDWSRENQRRILILADNFDMILSQIGDDRQISRLRDLLMNDGTFMLVGAAATYFGQARSYQQPLYNFFKIYNLDALDTAQVEDLLTRRAALDARANFAEVLRRNAARLRALEYFTAGNPRLVLMLYRIAAQAATIEVRQGLEKLLDEVTPYFKAKVELLPPQQRKILDHIAKLTSETREGQTPKQIAKATRLPANQVSAQLRRMAADGYVRTANLRGRESFYTLSEPLFAVWYQMRFGREARERVRWLVDFLRAWYDEGELEQEVDRLGAEFQQLLVGGKDDEARRKLPHRHLLLQAVADEAFLGQALTVLLRDCLAVKDEHLLRNEVLPSVESSAVKSEAVVALLEAQRYEDALRLFDHSTVGLPSLATRHAFRAIILFHLKRFEDALEESQRACSIHRDLRVALTLSAAALSALGRGAEAFDVLGHNTTPTHRAPSPLELRSLYLLRLVILSDWGSPTDIREVCREFLNVAIAPSDIGRAYVAAALPRILTKRITPIIRDVIKEVGMEQQLFPLVRAIDYVTTSDEALLEKLSPEVRRSVDEIVARIRNQVS
jgi:predicted RNA binding protein with dsRBD fold (UPF0201 family)